MADLGAMVHLGAVFSFQFHSHPMEVARGAAEFAEGEGPGPKGSFPPRNLPASAPFVPLAVNSSSPRTSRRRARVFTTKGAKGFRPIWARS